MPPASSTRTALWSRKARELDTEFGGHLLQHCRLLHGQQFAVTPGHLKACCAATHEAGTPTICSYESPTLNAEAFLEGLAEVIRRNQRPDGPCVGCRHLTETRVPAHFVAPYFTAISLHDFSGCNSRCVYCAGSEYDLPVKYTATFDHTELFKDLLADGMIRAGVTTVFWGGGEPTLVRSYDTTVDFLSGHHIRQTINTSGVRFSDSTERALLARTASVCVSVDSGTDETYRRVKRNPNVAAVWDSIRRYAATGGDLTVKYIIFAMNSDPDDVREFIRRCAAAGVRRIRISADTRSVFAGGSGAEPITDKELQAAADMRNLAMAEGIGAVFEDIWTSEHLERIGNLGGFTARLGVSPIMRLRRVSSLADAAEFARLIVAAIRRRLS